MKIFEFQFNPKVKKDRLFRVFSFEPQKDSDEDRGSMYIVGELRNMLPTNSGFLQMLSGLIFEAYEKSFKEGQGKKKSASPTSALKVSLREANDFLAAESKKGNVDWLGNVHLAILLFIPTLGGYTLYFTKVGNMKVWMARNGSLVDVGMSLEKEEDVGSSKVFGNVGSGKIVPDDRIAVVTKELFDGFSKENLLQTVSQFKEEKQFKNLFKSKEKALSKTAGVLLFFFIEPFVRQEEGQLIQTGALQTKFLRLPNIPSISVPSLNNLKKPNISIPGLKVPSVALPKISVQVPGAIQIQGKISSIHTTSTMKKGVGLLFVLAVILGIGFGIFKGESISSDSAEAQAVLENVQSIQTQAEEALSLENEKDANRLFQDALVKSEPYKEREEFQLLVHKIETQLQKLNKIEIIKNTDPFLSLNTSEVPEIPERILTADNTLYFFHPFSSKLIAAEINSKSQALLSPGRNMRFGNIFQNTFVFFADPNILISFDESRGWHEHTISFPKGFRPEGLTSFNSNIYLYSGTSGEIVRTSLKEASADAWISSTSSRKPFDAVSSAIDGNIWILRNNGEIQRYFKGQFVESLSVDVFPALENPTKIATGVQLPYLYILDQQNSRVLVLTKFGDVIRQYQSPAFKEATDFAVSRAGDTVYVLVGDLVFRIADIIFES